MVRTKHMFVKTNAITETCYFTKGGDDHGELSQGNKSIIDQLATISIAILEDLLSLLLLHSLPKAYQPFRKLFTSSDLFPSFLDFESKLLDEEMQIKMDAKKEVVDDVLHLKRWG